MAENVNSRLIGMCYPMEVNLVGDARETLRALAPRLLQKKHGSWRASIESGVADSAPGERGFSLLT